MLEIWKDAIGGTHTILRANTYAGHPRSVPRLNAGGGVFHYNAGRRWYTELFCPVQEQIGVWLLTWHLTSVYELINPVRDPQTLNDVWGIPAR